MKNSDEVFVKFVFVALATILWLFTRTLLINLIYNKIVASAFTLPLLTYFKTLCIVILVDLFTSKMTYQLAKE